MKINCYLLISIELLFAYNNKINYITYNFINIFKLVILLSYKFKFSNVYILHNSM